MAEEPYRLMGRVFEQESQQGIPNLRVEVWDKDFFIDDLLSSALTDETGRFVIEFDPLYSEEISFGCGPDIYFKVFEGQKLLASTEDTPLWNRSVPEVAIGINGV